MVPAELGAGGLGKSSAPKRPTQAAAEPAQPPWFHGPSTRRRVDRSSAAQRGVLGLGTPHVFLVPVTAYLEHRHSNIGKMAFDRHILPEPGVARLGEEGPGGGRSLI